MPISQEALNMMMLHVDQMFQRSVVGCLQFSGAECLKEEKTILVKIIESFISVEKNCSCENVMGGSRILDLLTGCG